MLDKGDEDVEMEVQNQDSDDIPAISIHALADTSNPRAMQMREKIYGHVGTVLIYFGMNLLQWLYCILLAEENFKF